MLSWFSLPLLSRQLGFDLDREVYPLVVHAVVDEGDGTDGRPLSPFADTMPFGGTRPGAAVAAPVGVRQRLHPPPPLVFPRPSADRNTPGSITCPCRDGTDRGESGRADRRASGGRLVSFFIRVPSFLPEYFGHCHVLLGTFEKVRGGFLGPRLSRFSSFPGGRGSLVPAA